MVTQQGFSGKIDDDGVRQYLFFVIRVDHLASRCGRGKDRFIKIRTSVKRLVFPVPPLAEFLTPEGFGPGNGNAAYVHGQGAGAVRQGKRPAGLELMSPR